MLLLLTLVEIPPRCRSDPRVPSYRPGRWADGMSGATRINAVLSMYMRICIPVAPALV